MVHVNHSVGISWRMLFCKFHAFRHSYNGHVPVLRVFEDGQGDFLPSEHVLF